jgi:hypothetical protein
VIVDVTALTLKIKKTTVALPFRAESCRGFPLCLFPGFVWYPTDSLGVRQLRCGTRMPVPRRRLDDRLREICAKLRTASNGELEDSLQELLALIHRKAERLKARGGRLLLQGEQLEPERRKSMM